MSPEAPEDDRLNSMQHLRYDVVAKAPCETIHPDTPRAIAFTKCDDVRPESCHVRVFDKRLINRDYLLAPA